MARLRENNQSDSRTKHNRHLRQSDFNVGINLDQDHSVENRLELDVEVDLGEDLSDNGEVELDEDGFDGLPNKSLSYRSSKLKECTYDVEGNGGINDNVGVEDSLGGDDGLHADVDVRSQFDEEFGGQVAFSSHCKNTEPCSLHHKHEN